MKRKALTRALYTVQNGKCFYCGVSLCLVTTNSDISITVDHIVPKSKGGKKDIFNSVASCRKCNMDKSDVPFVIYMYDKERIKRMNKSMTP